MAAHDPYRVAKVVIFFLQRGLHPNNYAHHNLWKHNSHQSSSLLFSSLSLFE